MFELVKNQEKLMNLYVENMKKMNNNYTEMYKLMESNMETMKEMTEEMIEMSGMKNTEELSKMFDVSKMFDTSKMFEVKVPGIEEYTKMCEDWYTQNKKMIEDAFAKYMPAPEKKTEKKSK